jgi:hypothetical protein
MTKKFISLFLSFLLILTGSTATAFAAPADTFKALGNTETGILYGYSEMQDVKIVLVNSGEEDIKITKITSSNEEDFTADLEGSITIPKETRKDYPVFLKKGKAAGTYTAEFTFEDENANFYTATVKAVVEEKVAVTAENPEDAVWDYEEALTAKVTITNGTSSAVIIEKIEADNALFEVASLEESISLDSLKSKSFDVNLPTGCDVGAYSGKIIFTDQEGSTYSETVSFKVVKKELIVPAITGEYIYSGSRQEIIFDANYIEKYIGLSEEYGSAVKAGHYAPVVYLKDKKNTTWVIDGEKTTVNQTLSWDIEKYSLTKPSAKDAEYIYSGEEQTFSFENFTESALEKKVLNVAGGKKVNAGTTEVIVSIMDKENFCWEDETDSDLTFTWTMDRKTVKEPAILESSFDYNGESQSITFTEGSLDETLMTVTGNARKEIGTQEVTVSLKDKVNYMWETGLNDTDLKFTLSIGAPVYNAPFIAGSYTYNGKMQQPALSGFNSEHMVISNNSKKDAGTYQVTVSLKDKENAVWADTNDNLDKVLTWVIDPAEVRVKAKDIVIKTGDVAPSLNADSYQVSGIILPDRLGFIPEIAYEAAPDTAKEGTVAIIVSGPVSSEDGNYAVTYENGLLTISDNPQAQAAIENIILDFDLPVAGSKVMKDAIDNLTLNTSFVTIEFAANSDHDISIFRQETDEDITAASLVDGLTEGDKVYFKLRVSVDSSKIIDPDVTKVSINGVSLTQDEVAILANGEFVEAAFTVPAYRIHFASGIGSGKMKTQYAYSNADYVIPASGFTAPSGMEFSCWKLEGEDVIYTAGEKVRLTSSINLAARYQEKKEEVVNPGGGSSGGGVIIVPGGGSAGSTLLSPREITKVTLKQSPVISVPAGVTYTQSKDGTAIVIKAGAGKVIKKVTVNGVSRGSARSVTGLKTGDRVIVEVK